MIFKPNTRDLETIAIMGHARAPVAQIAAALGISEDEFSAWAGRLVAARAAWVEPVVPPMPVAMAPAPVAMAPAPVATVTNPRIVADRLFECGPATKRLRS